MSGPHLILASASPRRRQLLSEAGYSFTVDPSEIDEPEPVGPVAVAEYVANLAWRKASSIAARRGSGLILGADTACSVGGRGPLRSDDLRADPWAIPVTDQSQIISRERIAGIWSVYPLPTPVVIHSVHHRQCGKRFSHSVSSSKRLRVTFFALPQ